MSQPFAELVVRIKNSDNGTLLQQLCAMFAAIGTMDAENVIVCWQALDVLKALNHNIELAVVVEKLKQALIGRMRVLTTSTSYDHILDKVALKSRFRQVVGPEWLL